LSADGGDLVTTNCSNWPLHNCYLATAIIRPGFIVGVTKDRIDWLLCTPKGFFNLRVTKIDFPSPVACFPYYRSNELILISSEGTLGREPMPR
jgi:hypothetical protein